MTNSIVFKRSRDHDLPSEEFLLPVTRYNQAVGPMFAEFRGRFPLSKHSECGLQRSLGIFLDSCFRTALKQMERLRPAQLSREEWNLALPETKAGHMLWQRNLRYLRQRNAYFVSLITHAKLRQSRGDSDSL
jgi:hypothetical protein